MILVVDDNPVQALTRKAILAGAGLDAQIVYSAADAFAALERDDVSAISLVITDHVMPGESGSRFVKALWQRRQDLPVIVLSGMAEAEDDYAGLPVIFRSKPIQPNELIALASELSQPKAAPGETVLEQFSEG